MSALVLAALVVAGIVVLTPVSDRVPVPQPVLLLVYGLLLALVPGLPGLAVNPGLVLPVVLPPLLFAATQRTTLGQFRQEAGPVLLLAVGLTLATVGVVAVVGHLAGLPWAAAAVLGAIVAPPDPVAATAVARSLRLPERMVTILEGEGMFNDATALVAYKIAVGAAVTGAVAAGKAALELALAVVVGVGVGLAAGWLTRRALAALDDASAETTLTLAVPFAAYLGAEHLQGSGVLAVLTLGLFLRTSGHRALTARGWVLGRSVWNYADFLVTSLVFVLVGYELTTVVRSVTIDADTVQLAVVVLAAVVLVRPVWIFPASAVLRAVARRRERGVPYGWRDTAVVSWAGMRGVVTVATALALPAGPTDGPAFPWRQDVVLVGLACVFVTLVGQGMTLTPLISLLGVTTAGDEDGEVASLRRRALQAALDALRRESGPGDDDPACRAVILQYEGRLRSHDLIQRVGRAEEDLPSAHPDPQHDGTDEARREELQQRLREAFQRASDVEREVVLTARAGGEVSPGAADEVLDDIEARASRTA
jgi:monovalent cation/hydrogen antiporter